ncbi:uncharacterized protein PFLUO_LOCUS4741 [Penicillium psychrofluorescens]|uniref:uncharacterized protein n=1 Tax=Penicillium psychrofluorescens TaxID=3158075 RepID=UPI003CCE4959
MEFPGSANTNVHLIDGFSHIYWRIYTEEPGIANQPSETPANGYTILKHLGRLKDLETRLRSFNCLASCPRRLGLWVFSPTHNFESLGPLYIKEGGEESTKISVDASTLRVSASGSITSLDLIKGLSSDTQSHHATPLAGAQRSQQGQGSSRRTDGYNSSAAIYASFISAITGALSFQLIRHHGALPLGARTFFTAVEKLGYENPRIDNDSILSASCLTTLNIQLTASGKLTVSTQTISQIGVTRLCSPRDDIADILNILPGTDLWLCPSGTIARLVTANVETPMVSSPGLSTTGNGNTAAKRRQWKLDVVLWLANFGLSVDSIDEEAWVEIEVWEPFFARLAGEVWKQNEESQSALPLKRMLWPARFCFKRTNSSTSTSGTRRLPTLDDPLEFAERWLTKEISLKPAHSTQNISGPDDMQSKDHEMSSPRADIPENVESLSRIAQYPDLQNANLVYPTPPDGATTIGLQHANPSEAYTEDVELGDASNSTKKMSANVLSPEAGQDTDLIVGSGLYDADDDEDLFGEMGGKDFGSKGITDADFSFFDDPGLDDMDDAVPMEDAQKPSEDLPETSNPKPDGIVDETAPMDVSETQADAETDQHACRAEPMTLQSADEPVNLEERAESPGDKTGQTISPPLSPVEIKKILFPGSETEDLPRDSRGQGHYQPVAFEKKIGDWEQKYGTSGKFWFSSGGASVESSNAANSIPTIGIPHRGKKTMGSISSDKASPPELMGGRVRSDSVSSSDSSDDSYEMVSEYAPTPMALPSSLKRKRAPSDLEILSAASPEKSLPEGGMPYKAENSAFLGNFFSNFSDWSLTGYFSALRTKQAPVLLHREEQIQIAQLLVDQITQSSLNYPLDGRTGLFDFESEGLPIEPYFEETASLGEIARIELKEYASLQDDLLTPHPHSHHKETGKGSIAKVLTPHVRVRRGKEYLEALPPVVSFWETFGLEPAHGPKDISAYCIHPHIASKAADSFLRRLGVLYQSCSLGTHARGDISSAFEDGMGTWGLESSSASSYTSMMRTLGTMCDELGTALSQIADEERNCVVYIINPFNHATALADICAAFWKLLQTSVTDADSPRSRQINEPVLQVIPMDFVMSGDSMVVPSQTEYMNLALEIYSRCSPKDTSSGPLLCSPPILLADSIPKSIHFQLASERGSPLQDGRILHIAYSKSLDQRWVSVAWSDSSGSSQKSMSYCLRYKNTGVARTVSEVRNEIWAMTTHIMDKAQARWKVILVNTEPVDADEVEAWTNLAEQHNKTHPGSLDLTILTVTTTPDLVLEPPPSSMSMNVFQPQSSSTPVTTPLPSASIASPEQSGTAATPSAAYNAPTPTDTSPETDSEAVLADICDESWMVVLSHRLNSSPHLTEFRPALASGYLLRRKGATDGDGVFSMTVNLIYIQQPSSSSHEGLLKETMGMYRDLASLARAKGIRSVQGNIMPWHIATALRAQELLSYVF